MLQSSRRRTITLVNNTQTTTTMMAMALGFTLYFTFSGNQVQALKNGLGLTPPMGWNTWNKYYCDINQTVIYTNTDRIKELGLD